jgi:hypothetical protein
MDNIDYKTLAQALLEEAGSGENVRFKHTQPTGTPTYGSYAHGTGGLFSYPGISKPVFSAMILPRIGLQATLPVRPSNETNPLYALVTGVTAETGSEPATPCADAPEPGLMKLCTHSFQFGRVARQTPEFELDRFGLQTNRAEAMDLQLMNFPGGFNGNPNVPNVPQASARDALRSSIAKAMFEFTVGWSRSLAAEFYTGNPSNNNAGGGRKYFYGLDALINTGYRDAITGQACPAADSIIYNFNGLDVSAGTNGTTAVRQIVDLMRRLIELSQDTGLAPVRWVLAMRRRLFWALTEVWPCAYQTYRCTNYYSAGQPNVSSVDAQIRMRDEMRTGNFLLIDGERFDVVIDNSIPEDNLAGGTFESDIYVVPMSVLGGTPVTWMEHIDYDAPYGAMEAARLLAPDGSYYTSDGGRFLWHKKPPRNFCVQMIVKTEPRLILLTPYVASRWTNLRYTPLSHERDWQTNSSYFADGGRTNYVGFGPTSFFSPTA